MIELWLGIALLTIVAIAFVYLPFVRARRFLVETAEDRQQQNIAIFKERLAELEQEKSSGNLDEVEFDTLKTELERNLLTDVDDKPQKNKATLKLDKQTLITVTLLALIIPVLAMGLYSKYGRSVDLEIAMQQPKDPFNGKKPTLDEAIAQLEKELDIQPENPEGWFLLATTYMNQGRFAEGADSFRKVLDYLPEDAPQYAGVMGQYAQALFFKHNSQMTEEVRQQIERTLAIEPLEITSLGLLGVEAFEQENYQQALDYWLTALRNADGQTADSLRSGVRKARDKLVEQGINVPEIPELAEATIPVRVQLSQKLQESAQPEDVVFVFAREEGVPMPLAALKLKVADLPADVVLDDGLAMSPENRLSSVPMVEVSARISKSGQPQAAAGDLYGLISRVEVRGQQVPLILTIDQVVE